jgi:hypothetical protein
LFVSLFCRIGWLGFSGSRSAGFGSASFRSAVGFAFPFILLFFLGFVRSDKNLVEGAAEKVKAWDTVPPAGI